MRKLHFDDAGNGNPPPKDDPTKKPQRVPTQPVDADPSDAEDTSDKK